MCTQIIGGKQCQYPDTCAAPGETCYDSVDGKPPLTCCDGYECQQIPGGKRCASNRETTTALPSFEDVTTTAGDAPTSSLFQGEGVNVTLNGSPDSTLKDSPLCTQVWTCPAFQLCRWTCV